MVVGGEVVTLKSVEESSSLVIDEMPINVCLLFVVSFFLRLKNIRVAYHLT